MKIAQYLKVLYLSLITLNAGLVANLSFADDNMPTIGNSESAKKQAEQQKQWQQAIEDFAKADTDTVIAPYMQIIGQLQSLSANNRCQPTALANIDEALKLNPSSLIAYSILFTCATKKDQKDKRTQYLNTINGLIKLLVNGKDASSFKDAIIIREQLEAPLLLQAMGYSVLDLDLVSQYGALYYRYHVIDLTTFKSTMRYFSNLGYMKQMLSNPNVSDDTASQLMVRYFERQKMDFALNRQAQRLIISGKYNEALEILQEVDEYSMHKKVLMAQAYLALEQYAELEQLEQTLSSDAKAGYIPAGVLLARIYHHKAQTAAFEQQIEAIDNFSKPGEGLYQVARSLQQINQEPQQTLEWYQQAAKLKHPKATLLLADIYKTQNNTAKAIELFQQAYDLGLEQAGIELVKHYHFGNEDTEPDQQKAVQLLEKLAANNNAHAHYLLGMRYADGVVVEQDSQTALQWLTSAHELGESQAANAIGILYEKGELSDPNQPDYQQAQLWYERAGERGDSNGFINLARWYQFGVEREVDMDKAGKYYVQAASAGSMIAYCRLADTILLGTERHSEQWAEALKKAESLYIFGSKNNSSYCPRRLADFYSNEKKDASKAQHFYEQAAANNNKQAKVQLERIYFDSFIDKDFDRALRNFAHGTQLGLAKSSYYLGQMYHQGLGIERDDQKALTLWQNALRKGFKPAERSIIMLFYQGNETIKDKAKALRMLDGLAERSLQDTVAIADWFFYGRDTQVDYQMAHKYYLQAAQHNDLRALNHLGEMYRYGYGVGIDYDQAKHWYGLAAKHGYEVAIHNIGEMYYQGTGFEQNYQQARQWLQQSAKRGVHVSQYYLGQIYQQGLGVTADSSTANRWYRLAMEQRHEGAKFAFGMNMLKGEGVRQNEQLATILITEAAEAGHQPAKEWVRNKQ